MKHPSRFLPLLCLVLFPCAAFAVQPNDPTTPATQPSLQRFEYVQPKMGTIFRILFWATDETTADAAAEAAWARVDQLNRIFSDYEADSELNHLCRLTDAGPMTQSVPVSSDMWNVLVESVEAAKLSDGTFDITVGPLTRLQRQSRINHKLPPEAEVKRAMQRVGWRFIHLDPSGHRVLLAHQGMQLDVGGIAKGYTSEQLLKLLRDRGITHALCGAAGDISAGDAPPGRSDFRVAIDSLSNPQQMSDYVHLHDYGISTSGDTFRSAIVNGKRYSHIIDPRTGWGLTDRIGVTALDPHDVVADWLAAAVSILGPQRGLAMVEKMDGAACRIVTIDEHGVETVYESRRFAKFLDRSAPASAPTSGPVH